MEVGIGLKNKSPPKSVKCFVLLCFVLFCFVFLILRWIFFLVSQLGNLMKYIFSTKSPLIAISATHYHHGGNKPVKEIGLSQCRNKLTTDYIGFKRFT